MGAYLDARGGVAVKREAYVFSIIALLLIAVFFGLLALRTEQAASSQSVHQHVLSADRFLEQLEEDLPRALRITAYRSLLGLEDHVSDSGEYLEDFSASFQEIILNGTVNGTAYPVMEDATLRVFEERMQEISERVGLDLQLAIPSVSARHASPFEVEIVAEVQVFLQTRDAATSWNYTTNTSGVFSILQLRDPLYTVGTGGRVPVVVREVNVSRPYVTADNDTTNLQVVYNNTLYHPDSLAPSFLMRFEGDLSASAYGIASLVDVQAFDVQEVPVYTDRSAVDYLYFGSSSTSTNQIVNMPSVFLLDDEHLSVYDAQDAVVS